MDAWLDRIEMRLDQPCCVVNAFADAESSVEALTTCVIERDRAQPPYTFYHQSRGGKGIGLIQGRDCST